MHIIVDVIINNVFVVVVVTLIAVVVVVVIVVIVNIIIIIIIIIIFIDIVAVIVIFIIIVIVTIMLIIISIEYPIYSILLLLQITILIIRMTIIITTMIAILEMIMSSLLSSKIQNFEIKSVLHYNTIASTFNHCTIVPHFNGLINNTKLKWNNKIQERSLRIMFDDYESHIDGVSGSNRGHILALCILTFMLLEVD